MSLTLALLLAGPAVAADSVPLQLAWGDGARWRVVDQWEVEATAADGAEAVRSGVVRGTWLAHRTAAGTDLELRDPVAVRITPRNDPRTRSLAAIVLEPWRRTIGTTPAAPAPEPAVEAAVEAAPVEVPAAEAAPAASADGQPTAAPVVAPLGPVADPLVTALQAAPELRFDRIVGALAGKAVPVGVPSTTLLVADEPGATLSVKATPLAWCPDVGPGSTCVELVAVRTADGATAEGEVSAGSRAVATWVVEPGTLVPHGGRIETVVAGGADPAARRVTVTRVLSFLPATPPAPLATGSSATP